MRFALPKTTRGSDGSWARWLDAVMRVHDLAAGDVVNGLESVTGAVPDKSYVRELRTGRVGVSPSAAFNVGEALRAAGVSWCSGILSVRAEPLYLGWTIASAGWLSANIPLAVVRKPWRLIGMLLYEERVARPFDSATWFVEYEDPSVFGDLDDLLSLTAAEHAAIAEAFGKAIKGRLVDFTEPITMGIRVAEIKPKSDDGRDMLGVTARYLAGWMEVIDSEWSRFGPYAIPRQGRRKAS